MDQEPQTPMTGAGPKKRSLGLPQQDGNGESETDFAVNPLDTYKVPATQDALQLDAHTEHPLTMIRRKLDDGYGRRSL